MSENIRTLGSDDALDLFFAVGNAEQKRGVNLNADGLPMEEEVLLGMADNFEEFGTLTQIQFWAVVAKAAQNYRKSSIWIYN